jgi:hypothetical protein
MVGRRGASLGGGRGEGRVEAMRWEGFREKVLKGYRELAGNSLHGNGDGDGQRGIGEDEGGGTDAEACHEHCNFLLGLLREASDGPGGLEGVRGGGWGAMVTHWMQPSEEDRTIGWNLLEGRRTRKRKNGRSKAQRCVESSVVR